jgi:hypothetical protein
MSHCNLVVGLWPAHHSGMAFRIQDSVVRGEIDNRVKGLVRGKIWVQGRVTPIVLELAGNAWPDLAGCLLTFSNPHQSALPLAPDSLDPVQRGSIGDLTASRKVRVFDIPIEEALAMIRRKEKPPEHVANSLYLEWFSEANGRVVIESADYKLTISAPEWVMTPKDEEERAGQAAEGMSDFIGRLNDAIEQHQQQEKDPKAPWDEHDYERFLKESDARAEKYAELLDKYGDSEEAEAKIEEEMGWMRDLTEEESEEERRSIEEINAACEEALKEPEPEPDPHREGIDWIRTESGHLAHPLQDRCFVAAMRFWHQVDKLGLDKTADKDLGQFIFEFQATSAKLAGSLGSVARGMSLPEPAFTVAGLKRALDHLHKSQAGLEAIAPKGILPEGIVLEARKELFEIREGILRLMDKFRGRGQA